MTTTTHAVPQAPAAPRDRRRIRTARLAACYLTIAACVPYLTLKIAWLGGGTVGWKDPAEAEGSALYVANAITLGMDALAAVVALTFTYRWGRHVPAWLVLTPIWVGVGLLAPIALSAMPVVVIESLTGPAGVGGSEAGLEGWVYAMVYGGFTLQAAGLAAAFTLYARDRWADLFRLGTAELAQGRTRPLQAVLAVAAAVLVAGYAAVQLYWAFGGTAGIAEESAAVRTATASLVNGVWAVMALAGAGGLLTLVYRRGSGPLWRPLAAAWVGSGSVFAWSLYGLVVVLGQPGGLGEQSTVLNDYTLLFGLLAGLLMGLTGAVLLTDREETGRRP
ncbi:hypothetical protein SAMN04489712_107227 [Thermomonospora echinospora]|uniref:LigA protein n=1 Tax=Thermomonospora echinospora TaxID=1992 RepID=A0A1H6BLJ8_9ACTN|nr:hypothetical protein [Thermomonospora echinospora]SEG61601.1 hypothetical protein SAMN04489712_107227 [Thermomonospora echinospora]